MTLEGFKQKMISNPLYHGPTVEVENELEEAKEYGMKEASNLINKAFRTGTGKYLDNQLEVVYSLVVEKFKAIHLAYKKGKAHDTVSESTEDVPVQSDQSSGTN